MGKLLKFAKFNNIWYNIVMYNWSIDEEKFAQKDSQGFELWKLEQTINFGQPQDKLSEDLVRKYWDKIKQNLDPYYRDFLELLLWPK